MTETTIDRRRLLVLGSAAIVLAPLAGCLSRGPSGESVRMSREGTPLFAGIREANSLGAVRADRELETAAIVQAGYMAQSGRMAHDTGIGRSFQTRMGKVNTNRPGPNGPRPRHGHLDEFARPPPQHARSEIFAFRPWLCHRSARSRPALLGDGARGLTLSDR
jgi:hypothetical protein